MIAAMAGGYAYSDARVPLRHHRVTRRRCRVCRDPPFGAEELDGLLRRGRRECRRADPATIAYSRLAALVSLVACSDPHESGVEPDPISQSTEPVTCARCDPAFIGVKVQLL